MIGEKFNLTHTSELGMKKTCGNDPRKLYERCLEFSELVENDAHFLERFVTGDETWVFEYDTETKRQSGTLKPLQGPKSKIE